MAYIVTMTNAMNVLDHAAQGDGSTDDAPALQHALDQRGRVIIPAGTYKLGRGLRIHSGTRLELHPFAELILADGVGQTIDDHLLTNANHDTGNEDITITGGIFNGNNRGNPRALKPDGSNELIVPGSYTGVLLNFKNVRRFSLQHALLRDSETYHFRATQLYDFLVEHIRFHSTRPRHNNDGIHLGGHCERGIIRHLRGLGPHAPSDDMVALNADDALERIECQGKTRGPIRDLVIHDLQADQCHSFVRILSTDAVIENIDISNLRGGCTACVVNMDGARGCRVQVFDENDPKYAQGVGNCRNIRIRDVVAYKAASNRSPLFNFAQITTGLVVERFTRDLFKDAGPDAPTLSAGLLPQHRLHFESLTLHQIQAMREVSTAEISDVPSPSTIGRADATVDLTLDHTLVLPHAGIERVTLDSLV